jgi:nucleoid DNA-binding protein
MANAVLINGNRIQLIGFDNFMFRELAARKGNPQSREEINIQCRKVPAFKQYLENNLLLLHDKKSDGINTSLF